jgi:hypothetical protein
MNKEQAHNLVRQTLTQSFDKPRFRNFVLELLNDFDESKAQSMAVPDASPTMCGAVFDSERTVLLKMNFWMFLSLTRLSLGSLNGREAPFVIS